MTALLLLVFEMDEEATFWALAHLIESPLYFRGVYSETMTRLKVKTPTTMPNLTLDQADTQLFQEILARRLPELSSHLTRLGVHPLMYVTPWFLCSFTSLAAWDSVLAIWDTMILTGQCVMTDPSNYIGQRLEWASPNELGNYAALSR